jgi:hypothetical protein
MLWGSDRELSLSRRHRGHRGGKNLANRIKLQQLKNDLQGCVWFNPSAQKALNIIGIPEWFTDFCDYVSEVNGAPKRVPACPTVRKHCDYTECAYCGKDASLSTHGKCWEEYLE